MMRACDLGSVVRRCGDKSQVIAQGISIHLDKGQSKRLSQRRRRSRGPNEYNEDLSLIQDGGPRLHTSLRSELLRAVHLAGAMVCQYLC